MRATGKSLRYIAAELGISISTASLWTRGVPRPHRPAGTERVSSQAAIAELPTQTRQCRRCHRELPSSAFARYRDRHQWWCRSCFADYQAARRQLNAAQLDARRQRAHEQALSHLRNHPCSDCGLTDVVVLEFDHVRGQKRREVSVLVNRAASVAVLAEEMAKCDVVCVNCHRLRTLRRAGGIQRRLLKHEIRGRAALEERLALGCIDCGESDQRILDLDHRGPKRGRVPQMIREGYSLEVIRSELDGCDVRCGNCHRRRTARERRFYRAAT